MREGADAWSTSSSCRVRSAGAQHCVNNNTKGTAADSRCVTQGYSGVGWATGQSQPRCILTAQESSLRVAFQAVLLCLLGHSASQQLHAPYETARGQGRSSTGSSTGRPGKLLMAKKLTERSKIVAADGDLHAARRFGWGAQHSGTGRPRDSVASRTTVA